MEYMKNVNNYFLGLYQPMSIPIPISRLLFSTPAAPKVTQHSPDVEPDDRLKEIRPADSTSLHKDSMDMGHESPLALARTEHLAALYAPRQGSTASARSTGFASASSWHASLADTIPETKSELEGACIHEQPWCNLDDAKADGGSRRTSDISTLPSQSHRPPTPPSMYPLFAQDTPSHPLYQSSSLQSHLPVEPLSSSEDPYFLPASVSLPNSPDSAQPPAISSHHANYHPSSSVYQPSYSASSYSPNPMKQAREDARREDARKEELRREEAELRWREDEARKQEDEIGRKEEGFLRKLIGKKKKKKKKHLEHDERSKEANIKLRKWEARFREEEAKMEVERARLALEHLTSSAQGEIDDDDVTVFEENVDSDVDSENVDEECEDEAGNDIPWVEEEAATNHQNELVHDRSPEQVGAGSSGTEEQKEEQEQEDYEDERHGEYHHSSIDVKRKASHIQITKDVLDSHGQIQAHLTCCMSRIWSVYSTDSSGISTVNFDDPLFRDVIKHPWDHPDWSMPSRINILLELLYWETRLSAAHDFEFEFFRCIRYIVRKYEMLPPSLYLRDLVKEGNDPIWGGGFADIYKGRTADGEPTCLKVLRVFTTQETGEKLFKEFSQEVLVWSQLDHPNVLPFLGINMDLFPRRYCLVSPWCSHGSIMNYLSIYPEADKMGFIMDILTGLEYLHTRNPPVVHGDLKGVHLLLYCPLSFTVQTFTRLTSLYLIISGVVLLILVWQE